MGIRSGCQNKIILQFPLVAVIDEIHTWIDIPVQNPGIGRNVGKPLVGIISKEIVRLARKFVQAHNLWMRGCACEMELQQTLAGRVPECQHRTALSEK